jgi:hypothetical protein
MRTLTAKWVFGVASFILPLIVAVIGRRLDHSVYRTNTTYKSLIPVFVFGSLALAILVPAILVLSSRMPVWCRVGCLVGVWCLLALELYWTFFTVLVAP